MEAHKLNIQSHLWQKSAMALAAAALFGLSAHQANALSLGNIVVQSALGEPLRAEIDIPEMNADEAATLKATVASPEAFRAAGLEFNAALSGLRTSIQRRANGRAYIRLTSDRAVNDPFVDMILEASWNTGRIVRDYTMLFDPPNLRTTPAAPTAPATGAVQSSPVQAQSAGGTTINGATAPSGAGASPRPGATRPAAVAAAKPSVAVDGQITVKRGDTASKIAMANKPATVSLDQMLVALLRANPEAFINSNINRIKSGAVVSVPTPEQALAMGTAEATQTVIAQSRDFGDFRKKLATNAPNTQVAAADRKSGGSVQAQLDDKKPSARAPDKLTLSKGALKAQAETARIAKDRSTKEAASRTAEVNKNMSDLAKLGAVPAGAAAGVAATASAAKPAASVSASAPAAAASTPAVAYTPPVVAPAATSASTSTPAVTTPATPASVAAAASAPKPVVKPAPASVAIEEPSLIDQLIADPILPAAGLGIVALLAGFGIYRSRQRKQAAMEDSAFLESRLQPDSFFGASGGQKVDTQDAGGGSSMVYTPSQLDAADDVDPVAEADVYLAYGRDVQAEEILREALKFNPGRVAIHQKLLEIFAKRRDLTAFESAARDAFKATNGEGPEWVRVCELGLSIDPTNSLYQAGGMPSFAVPLEAAPTASKDSGLGFGATLGAGAAAMGAAGYAMATNAGSAASSAANSFGAATAPLTPDTSAAGSGDLSFDLDLDFSLDEENANVIKDLASTERTSRMAPLSGGSIASGFGTLDLSIDPPYITTPQPLAPITQSVGGSGLEFELPAVVTPAKSGLPVGEADEFKKEAAVSFGTTVSGPLATFAAKAPEPAPDNGGMLEFDLGSLSLDLNDSTEGSSLAQSTVSVQDDPLATKLALAEEFNTIGDEDGARALIEEVIAEASGEMKARAQAALAELS
jgi:pilus assembly protein FimV